LGKIISVVGNLGAGKTTLTELLCEKGAFIPYWETPEDHPFQADFTQDMRRWALANQVDFFLFRCNQEFIARQSNEIAVFDGGFDQDFQVFTRHIYHKGVLNQDEFTVCKRYYDLARNLLPPPDLIIRIIVDLPTLLERRLSRGRKTVDQSFRLQELTDIERLLDAWLECEVSSPVLRFTFEQDFHDYTHEIDALIHQIKNVS
jgi:deoxyadenosine/deoxycytidine kinase